MVPFPKPEGQESTMMAKTNIYTDVFDCVPAKPKAGPAENIYFPYLMSSLPFALRPARASRGLALWPQCTVQLL